jgi:hypothetical protein
VASGVKGVAEGYNFSHALSSSGELYGMGENGALQLGIGDTYHPTGYYEPSPVAEDVVKAVAGSYFSLWIDADGTLWSCGRNERGQLGDGSQLPRRWPVPIAENVADAAAGEAHTLFVTKDGLLYACGANAMGQLGTWTTDDAAEPVYIDYEVAKVACGANHSLYLKADGTLWSMGMNMSGQLGRGVPSWGPEPMPQMVAENVRDVIANADTTLFIKTDNTLWGCGFNGNSQLGLGTTEDQLSPVLLAENVARASVGDMGAFYITLEGDLYVAGGNFNGELGLDGSDYWNIPVWTLSAEDMTRVASKGTHTVCIGEYGLAFGWGFGNATIGSWAVVYELSLGPDHALYLADEVRSIFLPCESVGAKWSEDFGWIDDTYYPWVWSYLNGAWFYPYWGLNVRSYGLYAYWVAWLAPDMTPLGWAYVYRKGLGCWLIDASLNIQWMGPAEPLPATPQG